jgi:hypothetical protein
MRTSAAAALGAIRAFRHIKSRPGVESTPFRTPPAKALGCPPNRVNSSVSCSIRAGPPSPAASRADPASCAASRAGLASSARYRAGLASTPCSSGSATMRSCRRLQWDSVRPTSDAGRRTDSQHRLDHAPDCPTEMNKTLRSRHPWRACWPNNSRQARSTPAGTEAAIEVGTIRTSAWRSGPARHRRVVHPRPSSCGRAAGDVESPSARRRVRRRELPGPHGPSAGLPERDARTPGRTAPGLRSA